MSLTSGCEAMEQIAQRSCGCPMLKARTMTRGLELDGL